MASVGRDQMSEPHRTTDQLAERLCLLCDLRPIAAIDPEATFGNSRVIARCKKPMPSFKHEEDFAVQPIYDDEPEAPFF
ncbi:hypothetical protein [uncultured Brevundimonas sp.]|uniref:hypothetical protein n=1 Tax=uncultured Brevundimonas sp. TaxID=213418 RepID=UPI0025F73E60|nr:hypothetical protein [uncultured Brevundimonas sp.]